MNIAVLGETLPGEHRVALIPASVPKLEKLGCEVTVVSGAGLPSHFSDEEYREAGATIAPDLRAALQGAGVVLKVQAPTAEEIEALPEGVVLISLLSPLTQPELIGKLGSAKVTAFALELIPRITRAQSMDVLSSQATVAGYKAVLTGADARADLEDPRVSGVDQSFHVELGRGPQPSIIGGDGVDVILESRGFDADRRLNLEIVAPVEEGPNQAQNVAAQLQGTQVLHLSG